MDQIPRMLRPPLGALPPAYRAAGAYHVAINPSSPDLDHLRQLQAAAPAGAPHGQWQTAAPLGGLCFLSCSACCRPLSLLSPFYPGVREEGNALQHKAEKAGHLTACPPAVPRSHFGATLSLRCRPT